MLLAGHLKNKPVVVISVAGAFRKGKSFLLNLFRRHLRNQCRTDWMNESDAALDGFSWRGGSERETTGMLLWSEVFLVTTPEGQELAVVLMDTQGTFDRKSTMKESARIISLSTMLSSVFIYNLSQNIVEDDVQHLQLFCDYAHLVQKATGVVNNVTALVNAVEFYVRGMNQTIDKTYQEFVARNTQKRTTESLIQLLTRSFLKTGLAVLSAPFIPALSLSTTARLYTGPAGFGLRAASKTLESLKGNGLAPSSV
ncbi:hypothetical protein V5799_018138 [Amblyomma americanum]|uniref:GB1/RHD3-type G domain-containing protein n=1 Tax=Amblyomma americanum TaxID=6943 RepID=A0AAQ4F0C1_AMBAM